MNTLTLQKQADRVEKLTREASRALLEFKVAVSKWELEHGEFKVYSSAKALMRDVLKKSR